MAEDVIDAPAPAATPAAPVTPAAGVLPTAATPEPAQPTWSADWRDRMARNDSKIKGQLDRYASPEALVDAHFALRTKLSSGELRSKLPADATPEQATQWRVDNGIPATPDAYKLDGISLPEADKPVIDGFLKVAHELNLEPAQVQKILAYRQSELERIGQTNTEQTARAKRETEDRYLAEWGGEYRANRNRIQNMLDATMPSAELKGDLAATMEINPELGRWLVAMANIYDPTHTLVGAGGGANQAGHIESRIGEIEKVMREDRKAYNRDNNMQDELRRLYDARARAKK